MYWIGITGAIASGKSHLAERLARALLARGYTVKVVALADELKRVASYEKAPDRAARVVAWALARGFELGSSALFARAAEEAFAAYPSQPGVKNRRLLQALGTDCGRLYLGANCWINLANRQRVGVDFLITPDVRFDNEARVVDFLVRIDHEANSAAYQAQVAQACGSGDPAALNNYLYSDHASEHGITVAADVTVPVGFGAEDVSELARQVEEVADVPA